MIRLLFKFIYFKILKWKVSGKFPIDLKKYIVIVAPHTSTWDFPLGIIFRGLSKEVKDAKYLGKKELFKPPMGWFFRATGGYPVNRSKHTNMVDAVVDIYNRHEKFIIALAPEGTRAKVERLKTGFYYIALKAKIPIVMVGFDYGGRQVVVSDAYLPGDDFEKDMLVFMDFFKKIKGKNPEKGIS